MTTLGSHFKGGKVYDKVYDNVSPELFELYAGAGSTATAELNIPALVASVASQTAGLGNKQTLTAAMLAWTFQDDDAHETCSLTACLNPLHPGPCKGWKGGLFKAAPNAYHALEAARVEKANANRIKKIQALKEAGKPIPKKLLQPIVAKPHPHAGKTANAATGEAHTAGKAVTDAAGVHVQEPGKVTLGQAVKQIKATDATTEKGAKGKKPTVASKGIAAVIAQEKVTPQYKLDKAAKITPEQWNALSGDEKSIIRGELAKIQKEGFGPQQKKATELLDGPLAVQPAKKASAPKLGELTPGAPGTITTPSGKTYQKVTLAPEGPKAETAPHHIPLKPGEPLSKSNYTPAMKNASDMAQHFVNPPQIHALQKAFHERFGAYQKLNAEEWKALPESTRTAIIHDVIGAAAADQQLHQGFIDEKGKAFTPASAWLARRNIQLPALEQGKIDKYVPQFAKGKPTKPEVTAKIPEKTTVEAKNVFGEYSKITKVNHPKAEEKPKAGPESMAQAEAIKNITEAIHGPQKTTAQDIVGKVDLMKSGGKTIDQHHAFGTIVDKLAQAALKQANEDKMPGLGHGDNDINITTINHAIRDHIKAGKPGLPPIVAKIQAHHESVKSGGVKKGIEEAAKAAHEAKVSEAGKTHGPIKSLADVKVGYSWTDKDGHKYVITETPAEGKIKGYRMTSTKHGGAEVLASPKQLAADLGVSVSGESPKLGELTPGTPGTITTPSGKTYQKVDLKPETPKIENAAQAAEKAPELPKHVQHAIDMADHKALGAGLSKNHLAAYEKLTADEFDALPQATQDKIVAELHKGKTKFLDPKKTVATNKLLERFGNAGSKPGTAAPAVVGFYSNHVDHNVTEAQAKKAVEAQPIAAHAAVAKDLADLKLADQPDVMAHYANAQEYAKTVSESFTKGLDPQIAKDPGVKQAVQDLEDAASKLTQAQLVGKAKGNAYNKIDKVLKGDQGKLSPIQKASLEKYQKYLLEHPMDTGPEAIVKLQNARTDASINVINAIKKASEAQSEDMSHAQIASKVGELLGQEAVHPKVNLTPDEMKQAAGYGKQMADLGVDKIPPEILSLPGVAAAHKHLAIAAGQLHATAANQEKLKTHLATHHEKALKTGLASDGTALPAPDLKIIEAHAANLKEDHKYLQDAYDKQLQQTVEAKKAFEQAVSDAKQQQVPHEPVKLTDYDKATISEIYGNAWAKAATSATTYGLKDYSKKAEMKAHPEYASYTQDLGVLQQAVKNVAVSHAIAHTAELNVPTDPDTGELLNGPEKTAWLAAVKTSKQAEKDFDQLHKIAQAKLDKIRTDIGLKKRALPKADSPAVKAAAAESAFYKTASYNGPNYGKHTAAKSYTLAKVGPKLGVKHLSASEKKSEKLKEAAAKAPVTPPTPKIENVPSGKDIPLASGNASIAHIPPSVKKEITSDFKAMPIGKYLADPSEDVFDNLVTLAAVHGKNVPEGGLSVSDVLKTIDETHAKNLGVANSGMLEKKITDWLGTAEGKAYAEAHSKPDMKKVKQLTGELTLPAGVELKPGQKVQDKAGPGPFDPALKTDGIYGAGSFKKITATEIRQLQNEHMKKEGLKFSPEAIQAMKDYSSSQHAYNTYLRGQASANPKTKQQIVDLQDAMMPAPVDMLLKRGTGFVNLPPGFQSAEGALSLIGKTFQDKAFVSSTVAGESGHFSHHSLQLIIEAPKGTPGVWMNDNSHFKDEENEYLLAAGTTFHVIGGEEKNGKVFLRVRVVSE